MSGLRQLPLNVAEPLITAIRKREILYNIRHMDYKLRNPTELAWKEVADEVGRDVRFCRLTWAQLRATYNRILAQLKTHPTGKPPKWYLFEQLSFLKNFVANGDTPGSFWPVSLVSVLEAPVSTTDSADSKTEMITVEDSASGSPSQIESRVEFRVESRVESPIQSTSAEERLEEKVNEVPELDEVSPTKKRKTCSVCDLDPVQRCFLDLLQAMRESQSSGQKDADLNFLLGLLPFLKEMTPRNKRLFFQEMLTRCNEILDSQIQG